MRELSEKEEKLLEAISLENSYSSKCHFTDTKIPKMETHIKLFNEYNMRDKAISVFGKREIEDMSVFGRIIIQKEGDKCSFCSCDCEERVILKVGSQDGYVFKSCISCFTDLIKMCMMIFEEVVSKDYIYVDKSGFKIINTTETKIFDIIKQDHTKTNSMVIVGCDDSGYNKIKLSISNIKVFQKVLKNPEYYDITSCNNKNYSDCDICDEKTLNGISIDDSYFCHKCHENLTINIEEFINKNKELIVSLTI